jgi:glycosyltransferase involved in cell wall biosynthesis
MIEQSIAVVAVARNFLDIVLSDGASKRSATFYIGVRVSDFQRGKLNEKTSRYLPFELASNKLTVIYPGTLGEAYDIPTLCEAARELIKRAVPIRFIFVGDGPMMQEVSRPATDHPESVVFVGSVPADELLPYYNLSDVGLCSYAKGSTVSMPLKVLII